MTTAVQSTFFDSAGCLRLDAVTPARVSACMETADAEARGRVAALLRRAGTAPSGVELAELFDGVLSDAELVVSLAEHMSEVVGGEPWQVVYGDVSLRLGALRSATFGSDELAALAAAAHAERADDERVLEEARRSFRRAGAGLARESRRRLAEIDQALTSATIAFTHNVDEASSAFELPLSDERARGLPAWLSELAREEGARRGREHPCLSLDMAMVDGVLATADDRSLREEVWRAHVTRAVAKNGPLLEEILALRHERAGLLGGATFAEVAHDGRMMKSPREVRALMAALRDGLAPAFARESADLVARAGAAGVSRLEPWDVAYFAEQARREALAWDAEATRAYFPYPRVFAALRDLVTHLFDVRWEPVDAPVWHPSVTVWRLSRRGESLAVLYVDAFSREGKRDGAWMSPLVATVPGNEPGTVVLAADVAASSDAGAPCLSIDEVTRLLHEVGHVMHHVLSRSSRRSLSGTRVAIDLLELPSTLIERLAVLPAFLSRASAHVVTGEPMPAVLLERCIAARRFRAASALLQRMGLAMIDLSLHDGPPPGDPFAAARAAMGPHVPAELPPEYRRVAGLAHVFGAPQGYEASLSTYVVAEVLAAQAASRFGEAWESWAAGGEALRASVLALGNTVEPEALVRSFLGAALSPEALLAETVGAVRAGRAA